MGRVLEYAKQLGYTAYTSTLKEAWRLSISGLSASIIKAIETFPGIPEMHSEEDFHSDPVTRFGIVEARRHRERGVSLGMFLGLMKYYRQAYVELIARQLMDMEIRSDAELFINRVFDRIEIGFCVEWAGGDSERALQELRTNNRLMTNEKNRYLTIFESLPTPVIVLDKNKRINNMNLVAARLFRKNAVSGSQYYREREIIAERGKKSPAGDAGVGPTDYSGVRIQELLPWLWDEIRRFDQRPDDSHVFEKEVLENEARSVFRVKFAKNMDVSDKFQGMVIILEDITSLKNALEEVKTLECLIPICSHCKKVRDDEGFWQQVENYVQKHSKFEFSHSICPVCARTLYPDLMEDIDRMKGG